jgi:hypothetical protein
VGCKEINRESEKKRERQIMEGKRTKNTKMRKINARTKEGRNKEAKNSSI